MKVAFITTRFERPSYRFRVLQYLPYLRKNGVASECFLMPSSLPARWRLFRGLGGYDVVFLQKRMLRLPDRLLLRACARRIVFDVDDAVMYRVCGGRGALNAARRRRFRAMARMSDVVLAGNDYLCRMAANYTGRAVCLPTVVDTDRYVPGAGREEGRRIVGWSGSAATNPYLSEVLPALARLARRLPFTLRIVSDTMDGIDPGGVGGVPHEFRRWSSDAEVRDIQEFDVGLMPLPDDGWARGKCALKALLYMACGVPAVCSPVGAITHIVSDGENGYLAATEDEWCEKIGRLLTDAPRARDMAERGRMNVEARYSVAVHGPRLLGVLRGLCRKAQGA